MTPKAIFFDIDGTLLSYNTHRIGSATLQALHSLQRQGVRLFIASGRPMMLIPEMDITFDGYVTVNGGYCFTQDKVIINRPLKAIDVERWIALTEEKHITSMAFTASEMFINQSDPVAEALHRQLNIQMPPIVPFRNIANKTIHQFIAIVPPEQDNAILAELRHSRMPRWHPVFSDIVPSNSNKAEGIAAMLSHFGLRAEEAAAFGDGSNDMEMLEYVGMGIAMGNANDNVKSHADYVTDDAEHEGIANAAMQLGWLQ